MGEPGSLPAGRTRGVHERGKRFTRLIFDHTIAQREERHRHQIYTIVRKCMTYHMCTEEAPKHGSTDNKTNRPAGTKW